MKRRSLLALVPLVLLACEVARHAAAPEDRTQRQQEAQPPAGFATMMPVPEMPALTSGMVVRDDSAATPPFTSGAATANMVIRTATARMDNARRLERRLIELLAARTGKLKDVLDVEQALARVREEIERYEGRLRYLKAHTATSTLSVHVHEPVPIVGSAGSSVMGEAFRQSWRNFVALVALLVQSLGVVLPLGALAAAGWVATRRWRRVISQRAA